MYKVTFDIHHLDGFLEGLITTQSLTISDEHAETWLSFEGVVFKAYEGGLKKRMNIRVCELIK